MCLLTVKSKPTNELGVSWPVAKNDEVDPRLVMQIDPRQKLFFGME
tara:strand:- start:230 stop:367 length:138 start_codon:yes stop_codon:yes gene_type:complete